MIALPQHGGLTRMAGPLARFLRLLGRGGGYVPTGDADAMGTQDFVSNALTSDPVRYARNAAVLDELGDKLAGLHWQAVLRLRRGKEQTTGPRRGDPVVSVIASGGHHLWSRGRAVSGYFAADVTATFHTHRSSSLTLT